MKRALHHLRTAPEFFEPISTGEKTFELRKDDRGFHVGDTLILEEWDSKRGYSGRVILAEVTYILAGLPWLAKDYVAMSIKNITPPSPDTPSEPEPPEHG